MDPVVNKPQPVETPAHPGLEVSKPVTPAAGLPRPVAPAQPAPKPVNAPIKVVPTVVGKTVDDMRITKSGSIVILDLLGTDKVHYFVKIAHGIVEVGGSHEWDTGRKVEP